MLPRHRAAIRLLPPHLKQYLVDYFTLDAHPWQLYEALEDARLMLVDVVHALDRCDHPSTPAALGTLVTRLPGYTHTLPLPRTTAPPPAQRITRIVRRLPRALPRRGRGLPLGTILPKTRRRLQLARRGQLVASLGWTPDFLREALRRGWVEVGP